MKTYRCFFIGIIFFLLFTNTNAQLPNAQLPIVETNFNWQNCTTGYYSGGIAKIDDSFYLLSANKGKDTSAVGYHDDWDLMLIKTDSFGNVIWKKCYGGSKRDTPFSLQKTEDGNLYLIGFTRSDDGDVQSRRWQATQIWLVKVDPTGNIIWERAFGIEEPNGFDIRGSLILPDGGIIISAMIRGKTGDVSTHYGLRNSWLVRYSAQGDMLWEKTYGNESLNETLRALKLTEDGTIICGAAVYNDGGMVECSLPDNFEFSVWLFEIDLAGNILWQNCYGGGSYDIPYCIFETGNNFIVGASSASHDGDIVNPHGESDIWLFETDNSGNLSWSNCLGGSYHEAPRYIFPISTGGYLIVGSTSSDDGDISGHQGGYRARNLWFIKVNDQGIGQWQKCISNRNGFKNLPNPPSILQKDNNTYIVAQEIKKGGGNVLCPGTTPSDDNPYVWLFEVEFTDQFVSVSELHGQSLNVSPNPAKDLMMFELPAIGELCIYSVSGRLLHKAHCLAGDYHYNCGHLSPGVYFYTFMMDEALLHGKVVVE